MHMADALISPAVGLTFGAISGGLILRSSAKVRRDLDERKVPLMGVLGAFVFAAQMINFAIPGTGSSGHLGGGLLLAVLLGPHASLLVLASVLVVQALFFADGGLLALGCNIFNMGFFPAFLAFPLVYKPMAAGKAGPTRRAVAALLAAILGLQLGAFSVVVEARASGISALPFTQFLLLMQPIHLAIGVVEGLATWAILEFIRKAQPEALDNREAQRPLWHGPLALFLAAAVAVGGVLSWYASRHPDGLEWAIARLAGTEELKAPGRGVHTGLARLQDRTALMPDYTVKAHEGKAATSAAGLVGVGITLSLVALAGYLLRRWRRSC